MRKPSQVVVVAVVLVGSLAIACSDDESTSSSGSTSSGGGSSSGATSSSGGSSSGATSSSGSTTKSEAGQPCSKDADCVSNLCATSITPKLCTKLCKTLDECPAELPVCRQVPGSTSGICGKQ